MKPMTQYKSWETGNDHSLGKANPFLSGLPENISFRSAFPKLWSFPVSQFLSHFSCFLAFDLSHVVHSELDKNGDGRHASWKKRQGG